MRCNGGLFASAFDAVSYHSVLHGGIDFAGVEGGKLYRAIVGFCLDGSGEEPDGLST